MTENKLCCRDSRALEWAKAFEWVEAMEWAKALGSRECAPDDRLDVPTVQKDSVSKDDTVGEMVS
jgi:hypothetical protein